MLVREIVPGVILAFEIFFAFNKNCFATEARAENMSHEIRFVKLGRRRMRAKSACVFDESYTKNTTSVALVS